MPFSSTSPRLGECAHCGLVQQLTPTGFAEPACTSCGHRDFWSVRPSPAIQALACFQAPAGARQGEDTRISGPSGAGLERDLAPHRRKYRQRVVPVGGDEHAELFKRFAEQRAAADKARMAEWAEANGFRA